MNRRAFIAYGWGRAAVSIIRACEEAQQVIRKHRPEGNWAILVDGDAFALQYQRLEFRKNRILYALGEFGLIGGAEFSEKENRFVRYTAEQVQEKNRVSMRHVRHRAHRGKDLTDPFVFASIIQHDAEGEPRYD